jgi:phosphinothricin acetyltransferase
MDDAWVLTAVALVARPIAGCVAQHKAFGFEHVGTMREVGFKFGQWVDVEWYQRMLV